MNRNFVENTRSGARKRPSVFEYETEGCFLAGQIAGLVDKEQTAKEIIEQIFEQTENILNGAKKWVK